MLKELSDAVFCRDRVFLKYGMFEKGVGEDEGSGRTPLINRAGDVYWKDGYDHI